MLLLVASFTANANSYFDIDSKVKKKKETLTDAQFNEYLLTLKGIEVNWRGKVLDVEKDFFGSNYTIRLDVDGDGSTDVWFEDLQKKRALTLSKGKTYDVSGEIKSVSVLFGTVLISMRSKLESAEDQKRRDNRLIEKRAERKKKVKKRYLESSVFNWQDFDYRGGIIASGKTCTKATKKELTMESKGDRFVSVLCADGGSFMVWIPKKTTDKVRVLDCSLVKAVTGVECFG